MSEDGVRVAVVLRDGTMVHDVVPSDVAFSGAGHSVVSPLPRVSAAIERMSDAVSKLLGEDPASL